jgi:hypothetical protein
MSRIVITSKTRMSNGCCVGAFDIDTRQYLRLLQANGSNQPANCPYQIGQYWDMTYVPRQNLTPPHVEDVLVNSIDNCRTVQDFKQFLLTYAPFYQGPVHGLFQGRINFTNAGGGYISHQNGLPTNSVGFWATPTDLQLSTNNGKPRYVTPFGFQSFPYVGYEPPIQTIARGTLVRVSLARWWAPAEDAEMRCYVQLSGWYI